MKKIIAILLGICMVLGAVPMAFATETEETTAPTEVTAPVREADQCGEDLFWKYDADEGVLTISGSGKMDDYDETEAPWAGYAKEIEKLVLSGVEYIGAQAFQNFDKLTEIDFGLAIREFGYRAFYGCDGLETLELPMSFKIFGEESLRGCKSLTEIHCDGGFPSFRLNCLWESYVTIYYPAERPWPVSLIQELEEAFHGRIEFLASDGTDPYTPEEETEATQATTAPTEQPVPETQAPTAAPTEAPTQAAAEAVTEAPVEVPEVTEAPMEQPEETGAAVETEPVPTGEEAGEQSLLDALKWGLAGMASALVLTVVIALVLILRGGKRGKYEF